MVFFSKSGGIPARVSFAIAGLWAGAVIGGSLIAAPAKFTATSLTMAVALDVGRAQFYWLGVAEVVFCVALVLSVMWSARKLRWQWVVVALILFAVQRLAIMPLLDERAVKVIAGGAPERGNLHLAYIVLELIKLAVLMLIAFGVHQHKDTSD